MKTDGVALHVPLTIPLRGDYDEDRHATKLRNDGNELVSDKRVFDPIRNKPEAFQQAERGLFHQSCVTGQYPDGVPWKTIGIDPGYVNVGTLCRVYRVNTHVSHNCCNPLVVCSHKR